MGRQAPAGMKVAKASGQLGKMAGVAPPPPPPPPPPLPLRPS